MRKFFLTLNLSFLLCVIVQYASSYETYAQNVHTSWLNHYFPIWFRSLQPTKICPYCETVRGAVHAISPTQNIFAATDQEGRVQFWSIDDNAHLGTIVVPNQAIIHQIVWNDAGTHVLLRYAYQPKARIYEARTQRFVQEITIPQVQQDVLWAGEFIIGYVPKEYDYQPVLFVYSTHTHQIQWHTINALSIVHAEGELLAYVAYPIDTHQPYLHIYNLTKSQNQKFELDSVPDYIRVHAKTKQVAMYNSEKNELVIWNSKKGIQTFENLKPSQKPAEIIWAINGHSIVFAHITHNTEESSWSGDERTCQAYENEPNVLNRRDGKPDFSDVYHLDKKAWGSIKNVLIDGPHYRYAYDRLRKEAGIFVQRLSGRGKCLPPTSMLGNVSEQTSDIAEWALNEQFVYLAKTGRVVNLSTGDFPFHHASSRWVGNTQFMITTPIDSTKNLSNKSLIRLSDQHTLMKFKDAFIDPSQNRLILSQVQLGPSNIATMFVELPSMKKILIPPKGLFEEAAWSTDSSTFFILWAFNKNNKVIRIYNGYSAIERCSIPFQNSEDLDRNFILSDNGFFLGKKPNSNKNSRLVVWDTRNCQEAGSWDKTKNPFWDNRIFGSLGPKEREPNLYETQKSSHLLSCPMNGDVLFIDTSRKGQPRLLCKLGSQILAWDMLQNRSLGILQRLERRLENKVESNVNYWTLQGQISFGDHSVSVASSSEVWVYNLEDSTVKAPLIVRLPVLPAKSTDVENTTFTTSIEWSGDSFAYIVSKNLSYGSMREVVKVNVWDFAGAVERTGSPFIPSLNAPFSFGPLLYQHSSMATRLIDTEWLRTSSMPSQISWSPSKRWGIRYDGEIPVVVRSSDSAELVLESATVQETSAEGQLTFVYKGFARARNGLFFATDKRVFPHILFRYGVDRWTGKRMRGDQLVQKFYSPTLLADFFSDRPLVRP